MIREVKFESQDRRIKQIIAALNENGIKDIEEANAICDAAGLDPYKTCEDTQMICFENAKWAYVVGTAIALKKGCKNAADAAEAIGLGLQAFCIPGSVADDRKVGIGHGNLAARLLREETQCFAFLAGHESFAAAAVSGGGQRLLKAFAIQGAVVGGKVAKGKAGERQGHDSQPGQQAGHRRGGKALQQPAHPKGGQNMQQRIKGCVAVHGVGGVADHNGVHQKGA